METHGLAIALCFAIGTVVGGDRGLVAIGFIVGAAAKVLGGLAQPRWEWG